MRERPATHERTERHPVRKALFRGEADGSFDALLGSMDLTAELMVYRRINQGISQANGMLTEVLQSVS